MLSTFPRLALAGLTMLCTFQAQASEPTTAATPEQTLIERGQYVARLGDCIACHTAKGGAVMAGGLELETPMGTIYSSNITPDPETGIGQYSFEQFDRAMREGVTPAGQNLYPAMPYPSYAKMREDDIGILPQLCTACGQRGYVGGADQWLLASLYGWQTAAGGITGHAGDGGLF